jgi:hypothetical protein
MVARVVIPLASDGAPSREVGTLPCIAEIGGEPLASASPLKRTRPAAQRAAKHPLGIVIDG